MDKLKRNDRRRRFVENDSEEEPLNKLTAKYANLLRENEELERNIAEFEDKGIDCDLKPQMQALHDYNEMKDATQMILGYLANIENVTIAQLHQKYNLPME